MLVENCISRWTKGFGLYLSHIDVEGKELHKYSRQVPGKGSLLYVAERN